jgi:hypothetical protein
MVSSFMTARRRTASWALGLFPSNERGIPYVASPQSILEIAKVFREFKPRERPLNSWSNMFQEVCNANRQSRGEL